MLTQLMKCQGWRLLMIPLLVVGGVAQAWAQNTFPASGNVGIGTTSPLATLHVDGHVLLVNAGELRGLRVGSTQQEALLSLNGSNQLDIAAPSATGILRFISQQGAEWARFSNGNVGIGTTTPVALLHVAGNAQVDGNIAAKYQDIAEWVNSSRGLLPATVVIIDPREPNSVTISDKAYDTRVAGVVSPKPGVLLGEGGKDKTKVAHSGRVRLKVDAR